MRKFALSFVACVASVFVAQSFAQPRDLFAEFEAENEAAQEASSSSVAQSSSSVAVSSSSVASSSSVPVSSSSAPLSSSAEQPAAPADSAAPAVADTTAPAVADTVAPADTAVADSAAGDSAKQMTPEEAYAAEMKRLSEENRIRDSLAALSSSSSEQPAPDISSSSMSRRDLLGPVKVSKVYGMDELKGRYKSPRKALFMSLVVPGSGQLYVGGSTFTYVRGGAYLALEAALWGSWAYFSVYKYNDQVDKYKKFAQKHYSIGRYEAKMRELYGQLSDETEESRFETRYMNNREAFCEAIYGDAGNSGCYTSGRLFYKDKAHTDRFSVMNASALEDASLGEETKAVGAFFDASALYQQISDKSYVLGWDDVEDQAVAINLGLEDDDLEDGIVPLGKSSNMDKYRSMRNKANDYADMQVWFFGGLILNHIISAVDAAFTANAHNKVLYSEELSWYDRLHFDSYVNFFNGLDVGVQASWGF